MKKELTKIISLNIEEDKHLERVLPFFKHQQADVILLQEVSPLT
jgi:exonuclease III